MTDTENENVVFVSAANNLGIDGLISKIECVLKDGKKEIEMEIPYTEQSVLNSLYSNYNVLSIEYEDTCIRVVAVLDEKGIGMYRRFSK